MLRSELSALIRYHTRVSRQHLTPSIALRLVTPECKLWSAPVQEVPFQNDPFWAFYWPGGQAISRFILDGGADVMGRNVLDVGSGCGACAIAALQMGASRVLANDIDPAASIAAELNAELNQVSLETSSRDLIGSRDHDWDTLLVGDMFYDHAFARTLFGWLRQFAKRGAQVYIGDPGRHGLTADLRHELVPMAEYDLPENSCLENRGFSRTSVWKLRLE